MAYINVDHSKFETAAEAIEDHVKTIRQKIKQADKEVMVLIKDWQADDYLHFQKQWDTVTEKDSVYDDAIQSLKGYAEFLRFAAEKYKKAQASAINNANTLPRY